jgi:hypothetical protein
LHTPKVRIDDRRGRNGVEWKGENSYCKSKQDRGPSTDAHIQIKTKQKSRPQKADISQ